MTSNANTSCPFQELGMKLCRARERSLLPRLEDISEREWAKATERAPESARRALLGPVSRAFLPDSQRRFSLLEEGGALLGAASFRRGSFHCPPLAELLEPGLPELAGFGRSLGLGLRPMRLEALVCGGMVRPGPGFWLRPDTELRLGLAALQRTAEAARRQLLGPGGRAVAQILTDLPVDERVRVVLRSLGYAELVPEPDLLLWLDPRWERFSDYLGALTSKYRVKAKRAYTKSSGLVEARMSWREMLREEERLEALHEGVRNRASFCLRSDRGVRTLIDLARSLGERYPVTGYRLHGALVGFRSALVEGDTLYAHAVGIDYEQNTEQGVYPRMLVDYVQQGLRLGLRRIHFGRTAAEIKSTLGAIPVESRCWIKHRNPLINRLLPSLFERIEAPAARIREPFKKAWYRERGALRDGAVPLRPAEAASGALLAS